MYKLTEINIYPVKSLGGISLKSSGVEERGLKYDRRCMLVDEDGMFFTQREHPQMALLQPKIENGVLKISHKLSGTRGISIPKEPNGGKLINVIVWNDQCKAMTYSKNIDEWFSDSLGFKCRLVYMPDSTERRVNPAYVENKIVSFADAYPFLIIGEESLNELNRRMESPLPMNRFRPNLVFSGGESFDEDKWKKIVIGEVNFLVVKPCARCTITTVNQNTGERGKEPLKTLATFRNFDGKVLFGQNMVSENRGEIHLGSEINIAEWK
ncbi:MAG TPA: MOSC N-terminal beta barrel domain-containing protein [Ignavibacteriaceae bacterium]|jgi:uncharacterized protein YcbX